MTGPCFIFFSIEEIAWLRVCVLIWWWQIATGRGLYWGEFSLCWIYDSGASYLCEHCCLIWACRYDPPHKWRGKNKMAAFPVPVLLLARRNNAFIYKTKKMKDE
jgi:hypothetical protein